MLDSKTAQQVLSAALKEGGTFSEIFLEDKLNNVLTMRNEIVETISSGRIHGAGVRVFDGLRCVYAYTNDTSLPGLLDCAAKVAAAIRSAPKGIDIALTERAVPNAHSIVHYPGDTGHQKRIALMREAVLAAKAVSPEIVQAQCRYADSDQRVWIANSEGLSVHDRRVYTRIFPSAVATDGTENQTGYEPVGAMRGIELFDTVDVAALGRTAAERAVLMLHAPACPAGVMPVIVGKSGGALFHEACGHSLEATSLSRGNSEFSGKLNQKIAADCVTAIDDGTEPNAWGSLNVDDEGMPTQRLVLIENGILKNYMIDKLGSLRMGMQPTGSGRREGYKYAPTSRMTNTYIAAGTDTEAEMIATMGDGLYAKNMGGGSVNPTTGVFNFAVDEGYLVKDGKLASPVRGASLIGRGSEVLLKIDRVADDVGAEQGVCGSMSGGVPVIIGQPAIRISSLTVGGR